MAEAAKVRERVLTAPSSGPSSTAWRERPSKKLGERRLRALPRCAVILSDGRRSARTGSDLLKHGEHLGAPRLSGGEIAGDLERLAGGRSAGGSVRKSVKIGGPRADSSDEEIVELDLPEAQWEVLKDFAEYATELENNSLVKEGIPARLKVSWTAEEGLSFEAEIPDKERIGWRQRASS